MAPNGSEFSHSVWIPFFIFFLLALSLRKFTGSYCIVFTHVYIILLRNTQSRSSRKIIAGLISWWFWCKYFAQDFILYSNCSKKIYRLPILYLNTVPYLLWDPGIVCLCFVGKKGSVTIPHCDSCSARNITSLGFLRRGLDVDLVMHAGAHACWDWGTTQRRLPPPYPREEQWH